jgi:hypothetical protein
MPLCPQITNTPITVSLTADFTVTNVIPVLPADTEQLAVINTEVEAAVADAEAALTEAELAYDTAIGSLQPSANTIVNASNQITAINAGGITVYSGSSPDTGARVRLNNLGLAGFDASNNPTFSISASTGAAVFSGSVTGAAITGSSLNIAGKFIVNGTTGLMTATDGTFAGTINSSTINGSTITGGTVQTSTGTAAVILNGSSNAIQFKVGGSTLSNLVPLSGGGLLMHYGATPDPSAGSFPQIFVGPSNCSISSSVGNSIGVSDLLGVTFSGTASALAAFFIKDSSISSAAPNGRIDSDGRTRRTTGSSIRFKDNVVNLSTVAEMLPSKLLELPVRAFKFKADYLDAADNRVDTIVPGFIAEEVDQYYPSAADYDIDGIPENWNERFIIPGMLALIQDLYKEIAILKGE